MVTGGGRGDEWVVGSKSCAAKRRIEVRRKVRAVAGEKRSRTGRDCLLMVIWGGTPSENRLTLIVDANRN